MSEWLSSGINTKSYQEVSTCHEIKGCVGKRLEAGGKGRKGKEEKKDEEKKGEEKGTEWDGKSVRKEK